MWHHIDQDQQSPKEILSLYYLWKEDSKVLGHPSQQQAPYGPQNKKGKACDTHVIRIGCFEIFQVLFVTSRLEKLDLRSSDT